MLGNASVGILPEEFRQEKKTINGCKVLLEADACFVTMPESTAHTSKTRFIKTYNTKSGFLTYSRVHFYLCQ